MSVYAVDKLMTETRRLAAEYHRLTGQILPVSSELSKYDAARLLGFVEPESIESGVDLIGIKQWQNQKVQVKSRVLFPNSKSKQRVGQLNYEGGWDLVALVLMDPNYDPTEIYLATRELLNPTIQEQALDRKKKSNKGAMSVAKFKALAELVWQAKPEAD